MLPKLFFFICLLCKAAHAFAQSLSYHPTDDGNASAHLQDIVTWDEYSIMVRGERVLFFSGEFHPFRLPSPGLWLDVFQKIRAVGYTGVSFYLNWALLEGTPGEFRAAGVFAVEEFFDAATEAGIYLLARPGPYVNSELSGGGFPGWTARIKGPVRTNETDWLEATKNYIDNVGAIISKAQITNGGPIILFQPENEYTICADALAEGGGIDAIDRLSHCLNPQYMAEVQAMWREAGIVLPYLINDALPIGNFAPGSGTGAGDIYGYDGYPLGWGRTCESPSDWDREGVIFPTTIHNFTVHMEMSPSTPFSLVEWQGGTAEPWGGAGTEACASLLNQEFERVIYKTMYGFRATILNLYMMFGGTNWGNMGHPHGYTSYDNGANVAENRLIHREKYSELKLQANFLQASPAYLTSMPSNGTFGIFTDTDNLVTTELSAAESNGAFYIVRHGDWTAQEEARYLLKVETNGREVTIPQLGGKLSLPGRDARIHTVGYDVGDIKLHYSSAEIFTWRKSSHKTVLVLYGGAGETHEFGVPAELGCPTWIEGNDGVRCEQRDGSTVVQWQVEPERRVIHFGTELEVYLLWRNEAYNYWVLDLPKPEPIGKFPSASRLNDTDASVIVKAGYLLRNASLSDGSLYLWGDVNCTTTIEVISPTLPCGAALYFNGEKVEGAANVNGRLTGSINYTEPEIDLPDFEEADWWYLDSLPEVARSGYDDSVWRAADLKNTNNTRPLTTPTSLYASDYGFHSGSLLYRGHFIATGSESSVFLSLSGGSAFGASVWLNSSFLGSWAGDPEALLHNQTFNFNCSLLSDHDYVITVLIDHMGLTQNTYIGVEGVKEPRGILDYSLSGHASKSDIVWKLTGNIGGENYIDHSRGPLNEGAMYAERQGLHLPGAPMQGKELRSPITDGMDGAGVGFFATTFHLDIPSGFDVPMSFVFEDPKRLSGGIEGAAYRVQLFVNGWQFGKYVRNIGPQYSFPVPEGILNHNGENYLALTLWSLEPTGAKIASLSLKPEALIQSGYSKPYLVQGMAYSDRSSY